MDEFREYFTVGQVARLLNISCSRVEQLTADGRLTFQLTPLGRLFDGDSVRRLATEREAQAARDPRVKVPAIGP